MKISSNFLVWKFCEKKQFPHSFGRFCAFLQKFHSRKLGEISIFCVVLLSKNKPSDGQCIEVN